MDNKTGKIGEDYTAKYLKRQGYKVVARNFHARFGEIDIVAEKDPYIVFIEVKTRAQQALVSPLEAVTPAKRRKLRTTAQIFLMSHPRSLQPRFDVAAVRTDKGRVVTFDYIENAF